MPVQAIVPIEPLHLSFSHSRRNLQLAQCLEQRGYQVLPTICLEEVEPGFTGVSTIRLSLRHLWI